MDIKLRYDEFLLKKRYKKIIYLIRHGETDLNAEGLVQGSGIDSSLNAKGLEQGERFCSYYQNINFDKIYVSALRRARQTVEKMASLKNIQIEALKELNEIDWGMYQGESMHSNKEVRQGYERILEQWEKGNVDEAPPRGESPRKMLERQKKALSYIESFLSERIILICMHGRAMRSMLAHMTYNDISQMYRFDHENLSLYKLGFDKKNRYTVLEHNNIVHLM